MRNYPLYIVITFSLSLLLIFALLLPEYRALNYLKQNIFKKDFELRSYEKHFQELQGILDEIKEKQESFLKIESALPKDSSLTELLNLFQKTASRSGLILERVSPGSTPSTEEEKIKTRKINLFLKGDYSDFKNFLSIIERSTRLIEVDNISFSYSEGKKLFSFNIITGVHSY
ncbi:MAG: type 4a pilus biogenesis protein PilO [Candidatus Nealsonbacteria bacterium]|nr:MAG: type 4a pilus biogenesis protein PilO [Candidatus Nealsonbacteria bacterium]